MEMLFQYERLCRGSLIMYVYGKHLLCVFFLFYAIIHLLYWTVAPIVFVYSDRIGEESPNTGFRVTEQG